ncbi:MAG TPA: hypothetical protein VMF50_13440 [Candidatus Binataceae bacterium]|nr:hypothetical protein [Candidatus Binataceae bacterium]
MASKPPPIADVESFLSAVQVAVWNESDFGDIEYVCSFTFSELRHTGYFSLVAGTGVIGRGMCGNIYVVDKTASGFEIYLSGGAEDTAANVAANIKDLRHDGNLEILIDQTLGTLGNRCEADWTAIFTWTGKDYTNVSDRFTDFYSQQLDSLDKKIAALHPIAVYGGGFVEPDDKECLLAEAAKIQRFLSISPEAGLDQAIRLAESKDWSDRVFAAHMLSQIGTSKARKYLDVLAGDAYVRVATTAKTYLSALAKGPIRLVPTAFQHLQAQESISIQ